ncbi:putative nucleotide-binding alpha-beta plait domain superfamily, RNA-binding domain superfamily [Helianthus anomalus]
MFYCFPSCINRTEPICRPWDLASTLRGFGEIAGVYIARKRNKEGLKFGFVSFKGVKDWKEMESLLKGILIGKNTLKINIARFASENEDIGAVSKAKDKGYSSVEPRPDLRPPSRADNIIRPGCSFKSILVNNEELPRNEAVIHVDPGVSAMVSRHGKALLVRVRDFNTLISIKHVLVAADVTGVEIQYVGGFNLLLTFVREDSASDFLCNKNRWKNWFSHVDVWVGQAMAFERVAWLRVCGVPLHLFSNEVLSNICSRYGIVAQPPQFSEDDCNLSVVCVGVLVGDGKRVVDEVLLKRQDKTFRVWVSEEMGDWTPDCLVDDDEDGTVRIRRASERQTERRAWGLP